MNAARTKPAPAVPPRMTLGLDHVVGWWLFSVFGSTVLATVIRGDREFDELSVGMLFLAQIGLWFAYGLGPIISCHLSEVSWVDTLKATIKPQDMLVGGVVGLFVQYPLVPLLYWPLQRFIDGDPEQVAEDLLNRADTLVDKGLLFIMIVVMAPLVEEIFYRGLFFELLLKLLPEAATVVVTAAFFAVLHFQWLQMPGLFLFGLVAGALKLKYRRLGPCWAMHAAFNALTFFWLLT